MMSHKILLPCLLIFIVDLGLFETNAEAAKFLKVTESNLALFYMPQEGTKLGCRFSKNFSKYSLIRLARARLEVGAKYEVVNGSQLQAHLKKNIAKDKALLRVMQKKHEDSLARKIKKIKLRLTKNNQDLRTLRSIRSSCAKGPQNNNSSSSSSSTSSSSSSSAEPTKCSSIEQNGITWTFDRIYTCGQYVNGDWWVKTEDTTGRVRIVAMSPDFDGQHNGAQVNMSTNKKQGFDRRAFSFDASLNNSLPYDAKGGEAIIKSISRNTEETSCRPCLQTAAVLTVVDTIPDEQGSLTFRPPFFGNQRAAYSVNSIRTDLLPKLTPPSDLSLLPSYTRIKNRFQKLQLDVNSYPGEDIRPYDNFSWPGEGTQGGSYTGYGGYLALNTGDSGLRFMIDDSKVSADLSDKNAALTNYLQYGIDLYHVMLNGGSWPANGGHGSGRKFPMILAAILLDNQTMKEDILRLSKSTFQEDQYIYFSQKADNGNGKVLFGGSEAEWFYWYNLIEDGHNRVAADPYGYIDCGHVPGTSYQAGINSMIWKGPLVAMAVMPQVYDLWNNSLFIDYVDRWVNFGAWAQNDPCAPAAGLCVGGVKNGQLCNYSKEADSSSTITGTEDFCGEGYCAGGVCEDSSPFAGQPCSDEVKPGKDLDGFTCGLRPNGNYYRCIPNPDFYGVLYGPDVSNPGECIHDTDPSDGIGRFPKEHGARADQGGYQSAFVNALWSMYRHQHCYNGIKDFDEEGTDCGGSCVRDLDGDGAYTGYCNSSLNLDCNDSNAHINPSQPEICTPGGEYDDNCDGIMHSSYYTDIDGDGVNDCEDNCPNDCNADQNDSDYDGVGDVCDYTLQSYEDFETMADPAVRAKLGGLSFEAVKGTPSLGNVGCCGYSGRALLTRSTSGGETMAVTKEGRSEWSSYTLKLIAGFAYTDGGIILHYHDPQNFYLLSLRYDRLEKWSNGLMTVIGGSGDSVAMPWDRANSEYEIDSDMGDTFKLTVIKDGTKTRVFQDASPHVTHGSVGIWDKQPGQFNYLEMDNIEVTIQASPDFPGKCR